MQRLFPRTIFANQNTLAEQFDHIRSEYREAEEADTAEKRHEELMDLMHSIQTYFDILEKQGGDVDAVRRRVIKKNRRRGYYYEG